MSPSSAEIDRTNTPGDVIRTIRKGIGMTLSELSTRTGIAASTLSRAEMGRVSLSYDKLTAISRGLGVDIAQLLGAVNQTETAVRSGGARRVMQRAGEGALVETRSYRQFHLATELLHKKMTPMVVEVRARTMDEFRSEFGDFVRHPGEQFVFVIEGELEFCTELYTPLRLRPGDTLYFDSDMGYAYLNATEAPCRVLAACMPLSGVASMIETLATASGNAAGTDRVRTASRPAIHHPKPPAPFQ